jgi:anthranilate phosphoribosyltransferase
MSIPTAPPWFRPTLETLLGGGDLTAVQMCALVHAMVAGECGDAETAALLIALRMKGESGEELAAAAAVLREYGVGLETGRPDVLDTCGTGGKGVCTFNISTAAALVAAAAGVPVVKHGNRAVSGRTGSADVLAVLGVAVDCDAGAARRCLDEAGMAFCLAPAYQPRLQLVGAIRRRLGVRTLFNCLGPLLNPARAPYQLVGVGALEWLDPVAHALARLGTRHALVVHGRDGLDEITLSGATMVRQVQGGTVLSHEWTPTDFGLQPCGLDELRVNGPEESAAVIRAVLAGEEGPPARMVLANAAAALVAAGRVQTLREGVDRAAEAVRSGRAAEVLQRLAALSRTPPPAS